MSVKERLIELSDDLTDLTSLVSRNNEQEKKLESILQLFASCVTEYSPTRRNLVRALNYINPEKDEIITQKIIDFLVNCNEIPLEWKDHIDNYRDSQYKGTILTRFIEKNGINKENTSLKDISTTVKPNRKMAICKPGCTLEEWIDFLDSFNEDALILGMAKKEKTRFLFKQLEDNSDEKTLYRYAIDQGNDDFEKVVKCITSMKIGTDDLEKYWENQMDSLDEQKSDEKVSAFTIRYLKVKRLYETFVGFEPSLVKYRRKLRKDIREILVGAVGVESLEGLIKRSMKIENDMNIISKAASKTSSNTKLLMVNEKCQICDRSGHTAKECYKIVP